MKHETCETASGADYVHEHIDKHDVKYQLVMALLKRRHEAHDRLRGQAGHPLLCEGAAGEAGEADAAVHGCVPRS